MTKKRKRFSSGGYRYGVASGCLITLAVVFQGPLTSSMALHMLGHIPLLLLAGVSAGCALHSVHQINNLQQCEVISIAVCRVPVAGRKLLSRLTERYRRYNEYGLPGLLFATFVGAYWMIPKALDDVLISVPLNFLKFVGLFLAGMILVDSAQRANRVIILFFLGSFSWMAAVVGLLYQDSTTRLCNFYLLSDQEVAGKGLVLLAIALPLCWLVAEIKPIWHFLKN